MPKTLQKSVTLAASADALFDMYLNAESHQAIIGAPVKIAPQIDAEFVAFHGMLTGKILYTIPKKLIVQTWRAKTWRVTDVDSVLVLSFWPEGDMGRIELTHVNVADHDYEDVNKGWETYYWTPWREYLNSRSKPSLVLTHASGRTD